MASVEVACFDVTIINDDIDETNEMFLLNMTSSIPEVTLGLTATLLISDDDRMFSKINVFIN